MTKQDLQKHLFYTCYLSFSMCFLWLIRAQWVKPLRLSNFCCNFVSRCMQKRPVVHKCVKKSIVWTKKCTDYLQISKKLCIFAPLSQWRMMVAAVGSTDILVILTKPIWFAGISQVSRIAKSWLMLVHILCTTFAVFAIQAMREPLRRYIRSSIFCACMREHLVYDY